MSQDLALLPKSDYGRPLPTGSLSKKAAAKKTGTNKAAAKKTTAKETAGKKPTTKKAKK